MSIVLLVMTDGRRDCIGRTLASLEENVSGPIDRRIIHDDSGDRGYRAWLAETFPGFAVIGGGTRAGFGAAIDRAWALISHLPERWVFHVEDDFLFDRAVDLAELAAVLDANPDLVQLALRRQAWSHAEQVAGGIVEQHPADYSDHVDEAGRRWLEHRRFFTTNPTLYRRALCTLGWPHGRDSEGRFSRRLFTDPQWRSGFWGARDSGPWVTHIGHQRVGMGY